MKRTGLILILSAAVILGFAAHSFALDPPHTPQFGVTCNSCHKNVLLNQPTYGNVDNTPSNLVCMDCHKEGGSAMAKKTHSANTTNSSKRDGAWYTECRNCHNPHSQESAVKKLTADNEGADINPLRPYPDGAWLVNGGIADITGATNTITVSGTPGWADDAWVGYSVAVGVQTNSNPGQMFRILNSTSNTIKVERAISNSVIGKQYGIVYGKYMKNQVTSAVGIALVNSGGTALSYRGYPSQIPLRFVEIYNKTGPKSAALSNDISNNANTTALCVVCHTQTKTMNLGWAIYNNNFNPSVVNQSSVDSHGGNSDTSTCWKTDGTCHKPLQEGGGVTATCGTCHGNVITNSASLVKKIKINNSLVNTGTGSYNGGAHSEHNQRYSGTCDICHYGGMIVINEQAAQIGDYNVTVAIWLNTTDGVAYTAGKYNGLAGLLNTFVYNGYTAAAGSGDGTRTCANMYCHGATLGGATNSVLRWTDYGNLGDEDMGQTVTIQCGACHGGTAAAPPTLGSHQKHTGTAQTTMMSVAACDICHPHTGSYTDTKHVDGRADWRMKTSDPKVGAGAIYCAVTTGATNHQVPTPNASYGNCSALYCHSNAAPVGRTNIYKNPKWGDAAMACDSCHDTAGWSSPHDTHATGGANYAYTCNSCHSTVTSGVNNTTISDKSLHVDATKQVVMNSTWGGTYATNCSNVYCHSSGDRISGKGLYNVVQAWSGSLGCGACHKSRSDAASMYSEAGGVGNMTDAHVDHVATDKSGYNCQKCHNSTTSDGTSIASKSIHVNQSKEVVFDSGGTWNSGNTRCSSTFCHGKVSDAWTTDKSNYDNCTICHGVETVGADGAFLLNSAPGILAGQGVDTNGDSAASDANVGTHDAHLRSLANYSSDIQCVACHTVPTAANALSGHLDTALPAELVWNALATNASTLGPVYTVATRVCSAVYCHGWGLGSVNATYKNPSWTNTSLLTGTTSLSGDCSRCHNTPPYVAYPTNHSAGQQLTQCSGCHGHMDGFGNFSDPSKHINRIIEATGCGGCHDIPPINNLTSLNGTSESSRETQFANAAGLHDYHYNTLGFGSCNYCHNGAGQIGNHNTSPSRYLSFGFDWAGEYTYGFYQATAINNATFFLNATYPGTPNPTVAAGGRFCSNLYCHSDGGNYAGTKTYKWANWDVGGNGTPTKQCNICHGGGSQKVLTDRHPKHVNGTGSNYSYTCYECHTQTVNSADNLAIVNHVDKIKNVALATSGAITNGGSYAKPQCSTSYCHSPGNKASAYDQARVIATWNTNNVPADCTGCHAGAFGSAAEMTTYAHNTHIDNVSTVGYRIKCDECHYSTATANTTVSNTTNHVNRLVNVKFDNVINKNFDAPVYNASSTTVTNGASRAPGYAAGRTCSAVYCHSTGNLNAFGNLAGAYNTVAWDAPGIGCTGCHGNGTDKSHPVYVNGGVGSVTANSHVKHVEGSGYSCDTCHISTTTDTSTSPTSVVAAGSHLNRIENVALALVEGQTGTYGSNKACSSTYCHGNFGPRWGDATQCYTCHAASKTLALRHDVHYNATANATSLDEADSHSGTGYVYGCKQCHPSAAMGNHAKGAADPLPGVVRAADVNGALIAMANYTQGGTNTPDSKGFNYTIGGVCTNTYCHSNGAGAYVNAVWSAAYVGAPANCDDCHAGTNIATGKHAVHATTYSYTCEECHANTVAGNTQISSQSQRNYHVNQAKDVAWLSGGKNQGGGTYASPDCSNIYCHSAGLNAAAPYTGIQVGWSDTVQCNGCHGGAADLASPVATQSHTSHVNNATVLGRNYTCQDCHNMTAVGNSVINATANRGILNHVDKQVAVQYISANATGYFNGSTSSKRAAGNTGGVCSNLYCHSTGKNTLVAVANLPAGAPYNGSHFTNVVWGGAAIGCNGCHGKTNAKGWPDYTNNVINNGTDQSNSHSGSTHQNSQCNSCHSTVSASSDTQIAAGSTQHIDGARQVAFNATVGGTWNTGTRKCSNMSCHSGGEVTWGGAGGCTTCHGFPPVSNATMISDSSRLSESWVQNSSGLHNAHVTYAYGPSTPQSFNDCYYCHKSGGSEESGGHPTASNKVNIGFNWLGNATGIYNADQYTTKYVLVNGNATTVYNAANGYNQRNCSAIYCHSDGHRYGGGVTKYALANWDTPVSGKCNKCHGDVGGNVVTTDKHIAHINTTTYKYICYECHGSTVNVSNAVVGNHVNSVREVAWGNISTGGSIYSYSAPNCSNIYCHSEGKNTSAPFTSKTADWSGTVNCGSCHSQASEASPTWSTAHTRHAKDFGFSANYNCNTCHAGVALNNTTLITGAFGNHVNKVKNVVFNGFAYSSATYTTANTQCTNTYCHSAGTSSASPTHAGFAWNATAPGCNGCHGGSVELASPVATQSHTSHVNNATVLGRNYTCQDCHNMTAVGNSVINATGMRGILNHVDKQVAVQFISGNASGYFNGSTASKRSAGNTGGVCSNLYCHSTGKNTLVAVANLPAGAPYNGSHFTNVVWGGAAIGCNGCHGKTNAKGWPDYTNNVVLNGTDQSNSHSGSTHLNNTCNICHSDTVSISSDTQIASGSTKHIDGARQVVFNASKAGGVWDGGLKTCSNVSACHSDTIKWGDAGGCTTCHGQPPVSNATIITSGSLGNSARYTVFSNAAGKHNEHYAESIGCTGCHTGGQPNGGEHIEGTAPDYISLGFNASGTLGGWYQAPDYTSSNGGYVLQSSEGGTAVVTNPAASRVCSALYCHSDGKDYAGAATYQYANWDGAPLGCNDCHGDTNFYAKTNAHPKHVNGSTYNYKCQVCHNDTVAPDNTITGSHVNNVKDVVWNADTRVSGSAAYAKGSTNCSSVYCHGDGRTPAAYQSTAWNAAVDCGSCHSKASDVSPTWSSKHTVHTKDYGANASYNCNTCHAGVALNNSTIISGAFGNHVNKVKDVLFNGFANASAAYTSANTQCTNTYCHSAGKSFVNTPHSPIGWSDTTACNTCHGNPPAYANTPSYAGGNKPNSHSAHSQTNCYECHYNVTTSIGTITNKPGHVNKAYNVAPNSPSVTFAVTTLGNPSTATPTVCSNISCHGGTSAVTWGATLACDNCHNGTVDVDSFGWGNATAVLNNTEWTGASSTGHGRTSGTYGSGNPAPTAAIVCLDCHTSGVAHNLPATNYFRLRDGETGIGNTGPANWSKNWICQVCHDPAGPGINGKDATVFVNSRHHGAEHTVNEGGQLCWDCHDPHGDSNRYMMHLRPWMNSSSYTMLPISFTANTVSFTANATGTDYVKPAPYNGVCQVCHTKSTVDHYRTGTSDGHNAGIRCTNCHKHKLAPAQDTAFAAEGKCNSCHGYPPKPSYLGGDTYGYQAAQGKGVHNSHTEHLVSLTGMSALNPDTDQWADAKVTAICFVCHEGATHEMGASTPNTLRTISMNATEYKMGQGNPTYLGTQGVPGATTPKTCSNVSCHYISTPQWESY